MTVICPTVTETQPHGFREYTNVLAGFAPRLHFDFADGEFAPTKLLNLAQGHWPEAIQADVHLMHQRPQEHLETLIALSPNLVILHVESEGDIESMLKELQKFGISIGIALLQDSSVQTHRKCIELCEHVLIFGGHLGYQGGQADLAQLEKVAEIRSILPNIEIAWDGGANKNNIQHIASAGVDVINVGGAIKQADKPAHAYQSLLRLVG